MSATQQTPAASQHERLAFGGYIREGADHMVVAVRERGGPWQLFEATGDATTLIERFFPDEERDAVQALAELYLAEMRAEKELRQDRDRVRVAGLDAAGVMTGTPLQVGERRTV